MKKILLGCIASISVLCANQEVIAVRGHDHVRLDGDTEWKMDDPIELNIGDSVQVNLSDEGLFLAFHDDVTQIHPVMTSLCVLPQIKAFRKQGTRILPRYQIELSDGSIWTTGPDFSDEGTHWKVGQHVMKFDMEEKDDYDCDTQLINVEKMQGILAVKK